LFSRTLDFYKEFGKELSELDEVILLDIYPARELPIKGVTSRIIFDEIKQERKKIVRKSTLINVLKKIEFDVLLILGAGDIGELVEGIVREFE